MILISLVISDVEHLLMCFLAIYMCSLEKCLFRSFDWVICFFDTELHELFVYFGDIPCWLLRLQIFSPILRVVLKNKDVLNVCCGQNETVDQTFPQRFTVRLGNYP